MRKRSTVKRNSLTELLPTWGAVLDRGLIVIAARVAGIVRVVTRSLGGWFGRGGIIAGIVSDNNRAGGGKAEVPNPPVLERKQKGSNGLKKGKRGLGVPSGCTRNRRKPSTQLEAQDWVWGASRRSGGRYAGRQRENSRNHRGVHYRPPGDRQQCRATPVGSQPEK